MQGEELFQIIAGSITLIIFFSVVIGMLISIWILDDKKIKLRNDYLKTLTDNEKAKICEWENLKPRLFERKNKEK